MTGGAVGPARTSQEAVAAVAFQAPKNWELTKNMGFGPHKYDVKTCLKLYYHWDLWR